jgi:hypothetical protein
MQSTVGRTCPYCQGVIKRGTAVVACSTCGTAHHHECWQEAGGCTSPGCSDATPPVQQAIVNPTSRTSACAVWSLVLGILSLCGTILFTGIPAIICGHVSLGNIRRSRGAVGGRGLAIGGLVTGYIGTVLPVLFILLFGVYGDTVRSTLGGAVQELGGDDSAVDSALSTESADWLRDLNQDQ